MRLRQSSLIFCICFMLGLSSVYAQTKAPPAGKQGRETAEKKLNVEDFTYNPDGARNPFEPILLLKAKASRSMSIKGSKDKGQQPEKVGYELEELRLVGVIKSGTGTMIAMMEDTQGKGIFFRKGDHLNKNMWVQDVSASGMVLGYKTRGETRKITVDIPAKN